MTDDELARNFAEFSRLLPDKLTHLLYDGENVQVKLDEREGRVLWVRRLDDGESEQSEPIAIQDGDIIVPFQPIHSTSLNINATVGDRLGFLFSIPVTEVHRDDARRVVRARTLSVEEPDSIRRLRLPLGDTLTFEAGDVVVELERIDRMFPADEHGYAPLTNTIWTWMTFAPAPNAESDTRYLLAAARRLDSAYAQLRRVGELLADIHTLDAGPLLRRTVFEIVGEVEIAVVALSRAVDMIATYKRAAKMRAPVPASVTAKSRVIKDFRDAYEHIEDRARGLVRGKADERALTIFDWSSLLNEGALTYGPHRLALADLPELMLDARTFLKAAAAEVKETRETNIHPGGAPAAGR